MTHQKYLFNIINNTMFYDEIEKEIMASVPEKRPMTAADIDRECTTRVRDVNQSVTDFLQYVAGFTEKDGYPCCEVMQAHLDKVKATCAHCFKLLMIVPHPEIISRKQIWDNLIVECQGNIDRYVAFRKESSQ